MNQFIRFFVERALILALLSFAASTASTARATPEDRTLAPYFVVESSEGSVERFPLEHTDVEVNVASVIAAVTVKQTYVNRGEQPIHARYVFPASKRAAVSGMRMKVGDRVVEAVIRERDRAKREFDDAKRQGKSASLLEEERPNVFTMSLANVSPGDRVEVELRYTELIVPEEGVYELVFPTAVGPRYSETRARDASPHDRFGASPYLHAGEEPRATFALRGTISAGLEIREATSPTHAITMSRDSEKVARFALARGRENDRDFVLRYRLAGDAIESGLSLYDAGDEKFFLLMAEPPARVVPAMIPPREVVFVVDVSGSMWGFPLDVTKRLLRRMAEGLRPEDRFNVLLFDASSSLLFDRSEPATRENLARAERLLSEQTGRGGTCLLEALSTALRIPAERGMSRAFVVVTDGYISAERDVFDHVEKHRGDANLYVFGVGSSVNRYLVEGLARAGGGAPFVVESAAAAGPAVERFERYVSAPVLTHVRARFEGLEVYDVEPAAAPDVLASRPVVIMGKYRGAPEGSAFIEGYGAKGKVSIATHVSEASAGPENQALALLWARSRVARLSDYGELGASDREKAEVTALGLRYGLLTRYTSFLAVMKEIRRVEGRVVEVEQPQTMPMGVSDLAVGDEFHGAPEPALALLLVVLALGALLFRRQVRRSPR